MLEFLLLQLISCQPLTSTYAYCCTPQTLTLACCTSCCCCVLLQYTPALLHVALLLPLEVHARHPGLMTLLGTTTKELNVHPTNTCCCTPLPLDLACLYIYAQTPATGTSGCCCWCWGS
jgi:hypothetical protein